MVTPGNFFDSTTVMSSDLGGNDAADANSASEHAAQACSCNMVVCQGRELEHDEVVVGSRSNETTN